MLYVDWLKAKSLIKMHCLFENASCFKINAQIAEIFSFFYCSRQNFSAKSAATDGWGKIHFSKLDRFRIERIKSYGTNDIAILLQDLEKATTVEVICFNICDITISTVEIGREVIFR